MALRTGELVICSVTSLGGLAMEAALKLLELSDGAVVATANSPLGFRHGPKTIVNRATLVVVFVSNDALARKYDWDLLQELHADAAAGYCGSRSMNKMPQPSAATANRGIACSVGVSNTTMTVQTHFGSKSGLMLHPLPAKIPLHLLVELHDDKAPRAIVPAQAATRVRCGPSMLRPMRLM